MKVQLVSLSTAIVILLQFNGCSESKTDGIWAEDLTPTEKDSYVQINLDFYNGGVDRNDLYVGDTLFSGVIKELYIGGDVTEPSKFVTFNKGKVVKIRQLQGVYDEATQSQVLVEYSEHVWNKDENRIDIKDFYKSGALKSQYSKIGWQDYVGEFINYYENGKIEGIQRFDLGGNFHGVENRYDTNGNEIGLSVYNEGRLIDRYYWIECEGLERKIWVQETKDGSSTKRSNVDCDLVSTPFAFPDHVYGNNWVY
jgi:hypothetical protein